MAASAAAHVDRLGAFIEERMRALGVPGAAVGLLYQGEAWTAGYGVTSTENPLPVTERTLFQIGSISKTFTTLALLRLVEQGRLELDVPVRRYLPEFCVADAETSARVTLRHLLTHTAGWDGDLFLETGSGDDALPRYVAAMAELPQIASLGQLYSYNNAGFVLAGYLLERVTGQRFEDVLQEGVLGPLGLEQATYEPGVVMTQRFAVGHDASPQGATVFRPWHLPRALRPSGGLVCSVRDLLNYARFQLGEGTLPDGTRLLGEASMAAMHTPQVPIWGELSRALCWGIEDAGGVRQVSHLGGTRGHIALLLLVPARGLALAVLTNSIAGGALCEQVGQWVLQEYLGIEPPPAPRPIPASLETLREYVGRYTRYGVALEIGLLLGRLVMQQESQYGFPTRETPLPPPPPPVVLSLAEPERLLVLPAPAQGPGRGNLIDAFRRPDGTIVWLRVGGRLLRRE